VRLPRPFRFLVCFALAAVLVAAWLMPVLAKSTGVGLTDAERAFLAAHPVVRIGVDPEFAPFEFIDAEGEYQGLGSEYAQRVGGLLGIEFVVMPDLSWSEVVEKAFNREIDVLPCVGITEERKQFFDYAAPYLGFPRVIISRVSDPYASLEEIADVHVAVQGDSSHHGWITDNTDIEPGLYATFREALLAVAEGAADVAIGNLAVSDHTMRGLGLTNLAITGLVSTEVSPLAFAVRNDWPELATAITKALAAIPEDEKQSIQRQWVPVEVLVAEASASEEAGPDYIAYALFTAGALIVGIALGIVLVWILRG
jgi:two-component system sensor histidine kinase EvgS